jgi:prolyl-tRNA editing enzyme YbaK/EbsC (Cys-tRNA(Pro) deacylase)
MEYLQGRGVAFTVLPAPSSADTTHTATRHGYPPEDVVAVSVMTNRHGDSLMVLPAGSDPDIDLAREALGERDSRPATDRELERRYPGYEKGCIPPLGLFFMLPIYADTQVMRRSSIVFALGRPGLAIRMRTRDLFRDDPIVIVPLVATSREPAFVPAEPRADVRSPADPITIVLDEAE